MEKILIVGPASQMLGVRIAKELGIEMCFVGPRHPGCDFYVRAVKDETKQKA